MGASTPASSRLSVDFPAPDGADDREAFAGAHRQIDAAEDLAAPVVGVPHTGHVDPVAVRGRTGPVRRLRGTGQPLHPGERGAAALQLLHPHQDLVQRAGHLLEVQRRRDHRAQADRAARVQGPAGQQDRHHRHQIGDLDRGEEHRAQEEGVQPGPARDVQRVPARRHPPALQPQRLDRAGSGRGGREDLRHVGVGGALGEIARAGPAQVPAQHRPQHAQPQQSAGAQQRVQHEHRDQQEQHLHAVDEQLGARVAQGGADGGDVGGAPGRQIAGAGPLHDRRGQRERPADVLLADPGEGAFAEAVAYVAGPAGQQQLGHRRHQDGQRQPVHGGHPGPGPDLVDDPAEQPGRGQTGERGERVQGEHGGEGAGVGTDQPDGGPADVPGPGHGKRPARGLPGALCVRHRTASSASSASSSRATSER
ncbi:hypothetical protein RKD41_004994 [Streptomyces tendae]